MFQYSVDTENFFQICYNLLSFAEHREINGPTDLQTNHVGQSNTSGKRACILGLATPPTPKERTSNDPQFWVFSFIYAYTL